MCILASMAGELLFVGLAMSVIANTGRALKAMCWALILGASIIALFVVVNSDPAATERVGQGTISATYFGTRIAFGAFACMLLAAHNGKRSRALLMVVLALLGCGLVASGSKCSILSFAVAIMVFIPRFRAFRPAVRGALLLGCIAVGSIGLYLVSGYTREYQESGAAQSLTGRTDLWPIVIQLIAANPIVGYGLNSFQSVVPANLPWESPHAHNEILQQWVTLGVVGVCLTVLIYIQALQKAVDGRCPFGELIGLIATFCVIRGMADPELWGLVYPLPMAFMFVYSNRPACKQSETLPGADYPSLVLRKAP
jgi:O-antigen ligase